jgi:hypothetical protein
MDAGGEHAEVVGQGAVSEVGDTCTQERDGLTREGFSSSPSKALTPSISKKLLSRLASVSPSA